MVVRAGGHVLTASGWEPEAVVRARAEENETTAPLEGEAGGAAPPEDDSSGDTTDSVEETEVPAETKLDEAEAEAEAGGGDTVPERATCELCGKEVAVNKDGTLRKHACVPNNDEGDA